MQYRMQDQDKAPNSYSQGAAQLQAVDQGTEMYYDSSQLNDTNPVIRPGQMWQDRHGNWFKYVKAGATLAPGQFVSFEAPTTGTVTAAGSTTLSVITNITTTANEAGNYLWMLDAVGVYSAGSTPFKQAMRKIVSSTVGANATFTLGSSKDPSYGTNVATPNALPSVPTNGSACVVIRPANVIVATASTAPVGVALGEITSGKYTIIQIAGLAMVQAGTCSTNNTVVGKSVMALAAGAISGWTNAGVTAANLGTMVGGSVYPLYAHTSDTLSLIPAYINFLGT